MQKNSAVLKFPHGGTSFSMETLSDSLKSLPWRLRAKSILDLMGYQDPVTLTGDACSAKNSQSDQMGIKTLSELCLKFGLSEEASVSEINALYLSSKKSISGETPSDIISNYKQVTNVLGREPINSAEVMDAISHVKDGKISSLTMKADALSSELGMKNKEIKNLESIIKSKDQEVHQAREELAEKVGGLEQSITGLKQAHEMEINELRKSHQNELMVTSEAIRSKVASEFEGKMEELLSSHHAEMSKAKEGHQEAITELNRIIDHEMVTVQEFDLSNLENEQLRDINRNNLVKIKELTSRIEMLGDGDFSEVESELADLKVKMSKLETAYLVTQEVCVKYKNYSRRLKELLAKEAEEKIRGINHEAVVAPSGKMKVDMNTLYVAGVSVSATLIIGLGYMFL